ncbi:uncharacterized protein LOC131954607 [Physella acuta]|uniref:uncharacterized protein LOC131954607 n=1 Tax=Physella acuta TaxID=109671 RepID=UPI0027DD379E|nr:uncharacterized protein LOC131954607 [Physella acuta]
MALRIMVFTFLCIWSISAQIVRKSIVPREIESGEPETILCDADVAGAPEVVRGVRQLKVSFNRYRFRATYVLDEGITEEVLRSHWTLKYYVSDVRNVWGDIKRNDIRLEILISEVKPIDTGEWCCEVVYFYNTDKPVSSTRCQAVMVSCRAIVHPTQATVPDPVLITCDADLAGVPYTATELDYMMLDWKIGKEYDPDKIVLYEIAHNMLNRSKIYINLQKPRGKSHWEFFNEGAIMKPNQRIEKSPLKFGIKITSSKVHDTGVYCCGGNYFDTANVRRWSHRCQNLSVSSLSIAPKKVAEGQEFRVYCNADLAGVPADVMGMDRLEIFWEDSIHPMSLYSYSISHSPEEFAFIDQNLKSKWQFSSQGTKPLNQHGWLNVDKFRVELHVPSAGVYDAGLFCCEGAYYDLTRKLQVSTRCQNMTVITNVFGDADIGNSRNGSGFICTADVLLLGLIAFIIKSWST